MYYRKYIFVLNLKISYGEQFETSPTDKAKMSTDQKLEQRPDPQTKKFRISLFNSQRTFIRFSYFKILPTHQPSTTQTTLDTPTLKFHPGLMDFAFIAAAGDSKVIKNVINHKVEPFSSHLSWVLRGGSWTLGSSPRIGFFESKFVQMQKFLKKKLKNSAASTCISSKLWIFFANKLVLLNPTFP